MCARVMAHLFSDIRNGGWQTLYSNVTLIAPPRENSSDHASHTRQRPHDTSRGIFDRWGSRICDEDERGGGGAGRVYSRRGCVECESVIQKRGRVKQPTRLQGLCIVSSAPPLLICLPFSFLPLSNCNFPYDNTSKVLCYANS